MANETSGTTDRQTEKDALVDDNAKAMLEELLWQQMEYFKPAAMLELLWQQMEYFKPAELLAIPEIIRLYRAGRKEVASGSPMVYIAAAVTSIWQAGHLAGKKAQANALGWATDALPVAGHAVLSEVPTTGSSEVGQEAQGGNHNDQRN